MDERKREQATTQAIQLQQAEVATQQTTGTDNTNTETTGRTKCERYSRIVGYLRPLQQWNKGKQAEWVDRKTFVFGKCGCDKEN